MSTQLTPLSYPRYYASIYGASEYITKCKRFRICKGIQGKDETIWWIITNPFSGEDYLKWANWLREAGLYYPTRFNYRREALAALSKQLEMIS